ncbi:putative beta-defensin 109B [Lacerta agilis]|uniref:putative beta-defensin 109B n=1 Tax=Lacerta agilis TaxID=80427 RepID=UPI0014194F06|nr:putative beta-defensin 109B [Lacerta agilis]
MRWLEPQCAAKQHRASRLPWRVTQPDPAMKSFHLLVALILAVLLVSPGNGEREPRYVSHCLRRGGICRYDDCSEGEEQIGTCYHHTMICCRDEVV